MFTISVIPDPADNKDTVYKGEIEHHQEPSTRFWQKRQSLEVSPVP